jgi:hypothetical protein
VVATSTATPRYIHALCRAAAIDYSKSASCNEKRSMSKVPVGICSVIKLPVQTKHSTYNSLLDTTAIVISLSTLYHQLASSKRLSCCSLAATTSSFVVPMNESAIRFHGPEAGSSFHE